MSVTTGAGKVYGEVSVSNFPLPNNSHRLARHLQAAYIQQAGDVARRVGADVLDGNGKIPDMEHWVEHLAGVLRPTVTQYFHQGIVESRRRLAALQGGRAGAAMVRLPHRAVPHARHTFGERQKQLGVSFDLFDPRVLRAVDRATLQFCEETNATAVGNLKEAIRKLRALLKQGLEKSKAIAALAQEIKRIFADPARAFRIATTETSRAIHAGALFNAQESNLRLKKEWLASADACPFCLDLDGEQRELDEPFLVEGTGPYARVMHPPLHPHCFCTFTEVLAA